MPADKDIPQFPDIGDKLSAPSKKSAFERKRADDEAKRLREAAENEAALADFVKSFGDDDEPAAGGVFGGTGPTAGGGGLPKRHYTQVKSKVSGPGSLEQFTPQIAKKRAFDGSANYGRLPTFESGTASVAAAFDDGSLQEKETIIAEKAAPKPTLQLQNLPPRTNEQAIRALIPRKLQVYKVAILPPSAPGSKDRKSVTAIVTFTEITSAKDLDNAVLELQNRYLGFGYKLSISRYLSSAALSSLGSVSLSTGNTQPFGAVKVQVGPAQTLSRAPPPQAFGSGPRFGRHDRDGPPPPEELQVVVKPPADIAQLRMIHKTIEGVLEHGEQFEALLVTNTNVQQDENWAWLFDARSAGGVYYRWKLWTLASGGFADDARPRHTFFNTAETDEPFDDSLKWQKPKDNLAFEFTNSFEDLTFVSDYSTDSGESDDGEDDNKAGTHTEETQFLSPIDRAKLFYFLSSLPTSTSRLTRADIAAITWFVVDHADRAAAEVVDLIIANIASPFALIEDSEATTKEPNGSGGRDLDGKNGASEAIIDPTVPSLDKEDPSSAKLVALYVLSDILFTTSSSGTRGAWRYRSAFEAALLSHNVFAKLGRLERDYAWGKMKAEKWKRAVDQVLGLWESQNCFSSDTQRLFREAFEAPPLTAEEQTAAEVEEARKAEAMARGKVSVSIAQSSEDGEQLAVTASTDDASPATRPADAYADMNDYDLNVTPELSEVSDTSDEDIDGEAMLDSDDEVAPSPSTKGDSLTESIPTEETGAAKTKLAAFSARFKAAMEKREVKKDEDKPKDDVDMFASGEGVA